MTCSSQMAKLSPMALLIITVAVSAGTIGFAFIYFPPSTIPASSTFLGQGGPRRVNWDPGFQTMETKSGVDSATAYWHPSTYGGGSSDSYISGGALHVRENDLTSTGWDNYDNAVAQEGNFPWQTECRHILGAIPDWACAQNSYGLRTLAWIGANTTLSVNATFLSREGTGDFNIIVGVYFYFVSGPQTANGIFGVYLEAQVRLAFYKTNGGLMPVGTEDTWNPGFDFGYAKTVGTLQPGNSVVLKNYDLHSFYISAMTKRGLDPTTPAIVVGLEPGVEGWGENLAVDFTGLSIISYESDRATADPDLDMLVNNNDASLVNNLIGTCPSDYGHYKWIADVNPTNPCIDQVDLAKVESYEDQSLQALAITPHLPIAPELVGAQDLHLQGATLCTDIPGRTERPPRISQEALPIFFL